MVLNLVTIQRLPLVALRMVPCSCLELGIPRSAQVARFHAMKSTRLYVLRLSDTRLSRLERTFKSLSPTWMIGVSRLSVSLKLSLALITLLHTTCEGIKRSSLLIVNVS